MFERNAKRLVKSPALLCLMYFKVTQEEEDGVIMVKFKSAEAAEMCCKVF
jgi:hypothetical protein